MLMEGQRIRRGGVYFVPLSLHIFTLTFSSELSMPVPFQRHIQDLDHRVWVLQGQTLTMVPKRGNVTPGEGPRQFLWQCHCVSWVQPSILQELCYLGLSREENITWAIINTGLLENCL